MVKQDLIIYGASGHGRVVLDAARCSGQFRIVGFLDDNPLLKNQMLSGVPILGGRERLAEYRGCHVALGIGTNEARCTLAQAVEALGARFAVVIHPGACVAPGVPLGAGTVVMAGVVVNVDARIGKHAILNTGATVDHDCALGDFVHLSPGVHLAGNVTVGRLSHIGIGASVLPGVSIGERCTIGAGAAVISNVADDITAVGVPARAIRRNPSKR